MSFLRNRTTIFWAGLLLILLIAGAMRLASYRFSLPYVDHIDEPAYYLGGQEWRGLYDSGGYYNGIPPAYVAVNAVIQPILESVGISGLASTVEFLRLVSVILNLLTLVTIALTARLAGGETAGLVAGAAWGFAPLILENGVYALPDPFIYCFTALALWFAAQALLNPKRLHWSIWSIVVGLLAVLMKYPALPALLPGIAVVLVTIIRERRGWRVLFIQIGLIAATGLWLVFIYGVDFNNLQREGATVKAQGISNFLDLSRVFHNIYQSFVPIHATVFLIIAGLGLLAYVIAYRQKLTRVHLSVIGLGLLLVMGIPWLIATYNRVSTGTIRYVIPATVAACVILGLAIEQIRTVTVRYLTYRQRAYPGLLTTALVLPLVVLVWYPQWNADNRLIQSRQMPDRRVEVRQWVDTSLDPGTVIVNDANHKVFNPFWGGIPYRHWVDWWITNNVMEYPLDEWVNQRGMSYALVPKGELDDMKSREDGQTYLAGMLHLRDFFAPDERGEPMAFYRLWRMQTETDIQFGDAIHLMGYDQNNSSVKPGDTVTLRFYWQATSTPADNYSLFIHLVAPDNVQPLAQADGAPAVPERPTLSWNDPSETLISPPFSLSIPADLPAGDYRVQIGLYNYVNGQRLPVQDADGHALGDTYPLGTLRVGS